MLQEIPALLRIEAVYHPAEIGRQEGEALSSKAIDKLCQTEHGRIRLVAVKQ